jgi:hypothetical protein
MTEVVFAVAISADTPSARFVLETPTLVAVPEGGMAA